MNVRHCEYLIAIAETGSLSKAAKGLGISQPTLSNFLSRTEARLGHDLFERGQKVTIPTEAGRIYLEACQRVVETQKRTYQSIAALHSSFSERFTVGVTPHRGSTMFARIFSKFYQRYSDISVELREGYLATRLDGIDSGEIDLAIGTSDESFLEKYNLITITQEELLLCVPDFHPLAKLAAPIGVGYPSVDLRRFQDTPFVMWGEQTANRRIMQRLFHENGMTPTVVYESNNVLLIDSMLSSGVGVGFLPVSYCRPGQHRVYFSTIPPLKSFAGLFYKKGKKLTEAQRYFVYLCIRDHLVNSINSLPCLNDEARRIYGEFEEADDGYTTA